MQKKGKQLLLYALLIQRHKLAHTNIFIWKTYTKNYDAKKYRKTAETDFIIKDQILLYYNGRDKKVIIPNNVTIININAFAGSKLVKIITSNSVAVIRSGAFYSCDHLSSITISGSVTTIEDTAFYHCPSLKEIIVKPENKKYKTIDGILYEQTTTGLKLKLCPAGKRKRVYILPKNTTAIGSAAFFGCKNITSITIPYGITKLEDRVFSGCCRLKSISIPNSVTSIGDWTFLDCRRLKIILIPNSVTSIGTAAFSDCKGLQHLTIPDSVTTLGDWLCINCTRLIDITIPYHVTSTILPNMFDSCFSLKKIMVKPGSKYYISKDGVLFRKTPAGWNLIYYPMNKKQASYTIPDNVISIGNHAFMNCRYLTTVIMPNHTISIDRHAFSYCRKHKIKIH